jgi:hypothetical protein
MELLLAPMTLHSVNWVASLLLQTIPPSLSTYGKYPSLVVYPQVHGRGVQQSPEIYSGGRELMKCKYNNLPANLRTFRSFQVENHHHPVGEKKLGKESRLLDMDSEL